MAITLTDYTQAKNSFIGYASIQLRKGDYPKVVDPFYVLGGGGDDWFRVTEGATRGYGLSLIECRVTSRRPQVWGQFKAYKVKIAYIPLEFDCVDNQVQHFAWLIIHPDTTLDSVLAYITTHSQTWRP